MEEAQTNLLEDQSSKHTRKKLFILFLIIFFTLIISAIISVFTVLKQHTESQSMSANPIQAITAACKVTHKYYFHCTKSLSSLHNPTHNIHASDIFRLSIISAFHNFFIIYGLPQTLVSKIENKSIKPFLFDCQNLFDDSLSQLNKSMVMIHKNYVGPDEETLDYDEGMMKDLRELMNQATKNVNRCVDGLDEGKGVTEGEIVRIKKMKERIEEAKIDMLITLAILENKEMIYEVFDPSFQSVLASFMLTSENYVLSVAMLCLQYLLLVFLFCSLLRVFK